MNYINLLEWIGTGTLGAAAGIGIGNMIVYYLTKSNLINGAIKGREPLITERPYKSRLERVLSFGKDLAEGRYKSGKFDRIIESIESDL